MPFEISHFPLLFLIMSGCFAVISVVRYLVIYHFESVKELSKRSKFLSYSIGAFIKGLRLDPLMQNNEIKAQKLDKNILLGAKVFHQYMIADAYKYEDISHLSEECLDAFSDLSAQLKTYKYHRLNFNQLKELRTENYLAEHFKKVGINIDEIKLLQDKEELLDENPIKLQFIKNTNNLIEHFKSQREISVMLPSSVENIPKIAFSFHSSESVDKLYSHFKNRSGKSVVVGESLSHRGLMEGVEGGTDLLIGLTELKIPFITAIVAGFREIKLLKANSTTLKSAFKHIGLDVGGVGGGSALGGVVGSVIPGIGTLFGFIGGAFLGRKFSNNLKVKNLKRVKEKYKKSIENYQMEAERIWKKYQDKIKEDRQKAQQSLREIAEQIKLKINKEGTQLKKWRVDQEKAPAHLLKLLNKLPVSLRSVIKKLDLSWLEYLWPSKKAIVYKKQMKEVKKNFNKQFKRNKCIDRGILLQKLSEKALFQTYIFEEIARVEKERKIKEDNLITEIKKKQWELLNKRHQQMKELSEKMTTYIKTGKEEIAKHVKAIHSYQNLLIKEAKKLGKNPSKK